VIILSLLVISVPLTLTSVRVSKSSAT